MTVAVWNNISYVCVTCKQTACLTSSLSRTSTILCRTFIMWDVRAIGRYSFSSLSAVDWGWRSSVEAHTTEQHSPSAAEDIHHLCPLLSHSCSLWKCSLTPVTVTAGGACSGDAGGMAAGVERHTGVGEGVGVDGGWDIEEEWGIVGGEAASSNLLKTGSEWPSGAWLIIYLPHFSVILL